MVRAAIGPVIHEIDRLYDSGTATGLDEGQLIDRFLARRDEAAFEAIVRRHGPMVLAVCRRLLRDPNDAEDAFQATFLVLVKKAPGLRRRELLANWLYGVAFRVASRARVDAARRRRKEAEARSRSVEPFEEPAMTTADAESGPALLEEVRRLPEKYRAPVVLCHLEGRTHEEAARLLKWPVGTVKGRLARARDLLQRRLSRRGVAMPSAAVGTWLAAETASAAVPPSLVMSTVKAAAAMAAGGALASGVVPGPALALANGANRTMFLTKWTTILGSLFATCGLVTGGAAFLPGAQDEKAQGAGGGEQKTEAKETAGGVAKVEEAVEPEEAIEAEASVVIEEGSVGDLDPVLAQMIDAASRRLEFVKRAYEDGKEPIQAYIEASRALAEAEGKRDDASANPDRAYGGHQHRMNELVDRAKLRAAGGMDNPRDLAEAEFEHAWVLLRIKDRAGEEATKALDRAREEEAVAAQGPGMMGGGSMGMEGMGGAGYGGMMGGGGMPTGMGMMGGAPGGMGEGAAEPTAFDEFPDAVVRSSRLVEMLNTKEMAMPFENPTMLEDVLDYIQQVTASEESPNGIPIFIDPKAMRELEVTPQTEVSINLEHIPLRTTLWLTLRQVGLAYSVIDGVLVISTPDLLADIVLERPIFDAKQAESHRRKMEAMAGHVGGGGGFQ